MSQAPQTEREVHSMVICLIQMEHGGFSASMYEHDRGGKRKISMAPFGTLHEVPIELTAEDCEQIVQAASAAYKEGQATQRYFP